MKKYYLLAVLLLLIAMLLLILAGCSSKKTKEPEIFVDPQVVTESETTVLSSAADESMIPIAPTMAEESEIYKMPLDIKESETSAKSPVLSDPWFSLTPPTVTATSPVLFCAYERDIDTAQFTNIIDTAWDYGAEAILIWSDYTMNEILVSDMYSYVTRDNFSADTHLYFDQILPGQALRLYRKPLEDIPRTQIVCNQYAGNSTAFFLTYKDEAITLTPTVEAEIRDQSRLWFETKQSTSPERKVKLTFEYHKKPGDFYLTTIHSQTEGFIIDKYENTYSVSASILFPEIALKTFLIDRRLPIPTVYKDTGGIRLNDINVVVIRIESNIFIFIDGYLTDTFRTNSEAVLKPTADGRGFKIGFRKFLWDDAARHFKYSEAPESPNYRPALNASRDIPEEEAILLTSGKNTHTNNYSDSPGSSPNSSPGSSPSSNPDNSYANSPDSSESSFVYLRFSEPVTHLTAFTIYPQNKALDSFWYESIGIAGYIPAVGTNIVIKADLKSAASFRYVNAHGILETVYLSLSDGQIICVPLELPKSTDEYPADYKWNMSDDFSTVANRIKPYIPKGFYIFDGAAGDINADGIEDAIVCLDIDVYRTRLNDHNTILTYLLIGRPDGGYDTAQYNANALFTPYRNHCGVIAGTGYFEVWGYLAGSASYTYKSTCRFSYIPEQRGWALTMCSYEHSYVNAGEHQFGLVHALPEHVITFPEMKDIFYFSAALDWEAFDAMAEINADYYYPSYRDDSQYRIKIGANLHEEEKLYEVFVVSIYDEIISFRGTIRGDYHGGELTIEIDQNRQAFTIQGDTYLWIKEIGEFCRERERF